MNLYALIPLFSGFMLIGFASFIMAKQSNRLNKLFLAFTMSLTVWNLGEFLNWSVFPDHFMMISIRILSVSWLLPGILCLLFVYELIGKKSDLLLKIFYFISGISIFIATSSNLFSNGFSQKYWGKVVSPGILYLPIIGLIDILPFIYSIFLIYRSMQKTNHEKVCKSLKMFLYGLIISMIIAISTELVIPHVLNKPDIMPFSSSAAVILCFFMLLAVNLKQSKIAAEISLLNANNQLENKVAVRTAELVQTRDFLESIFNAIKDAIIIIDAQGHIVRCNEQFYKLFHYQSDEVKNKLFDMLFSEDDLNKFNQKLTELKQADQFSFETNVLLHSGEENPVYISTSILRNSSLTGSKNQLLVVISDISQRKKAENRLLISQRLTKMIIENINETILVVQDGFIKNFVNKKFTGYSFDDVKNQLFEQFVHPDYREMIKKNYQDRISGLTDVPSNYQIQIIDKNGSYLWAEANVVLTKWEKKDATLVYLRDINKQKKAEEQLMENEKLFRAFIDQANDFIMIKSKDGKYLKINKKFSWLIGKTEAEIAGKTPTDLGYSPVFIQEKELLDKQIIENKITLVRESEASKSKKSGLEWLEETMFPILDDNNEVKFIGVISRDITEKKRAERELSIQNEQLQDAYTKLQESYKIIINQEKLASLGTMAAGIAHEINNPTQAIKFSMQSLKLNLKDLGYFIDECKKIKKTSINDYPKLLRNISEMIEALELDVVLIELSNIASENEKSVDRIQNIIQSTSRLSYHDQEMKPCDLKEVISDALILLHSNIKYQITVKKIFAANLPNVMGVHQQLEQVFINLINNARDAILEKGLNQTDALLILDLIYNPNSGLVEIRVSDNGNGIPETIINKIFDPFFTTKKLGCGTGLGLNLVHRIISGHNGTIIVDSMIGQGTTFLIKLPAA